VKEEPEIEQPKMLNPEVLVKGRPKMPTPTATIKWGKELKSKIKAN
jgi:hypothetical protein